MLYSVQDGTKTQCGICLKFITMKSLSKHMSAFHKEAVSSENNNNVNRYIRMYFFCGGRGVPVDKKNHALQR